MGRPTGRARVDPRHPQSFGACDCCGLWWNRVNLQFQFEYAGTGLRNTGYLNCPDCLYIPQPQLKTRVIPADPLPILNPRVEPFEYDNNAP